MNRCDVLRNISDDIKFLKLVYEVAQKSKSEEDFLEQLTKPLTEDELQNITPF